MKIHGFLIYLWLLEKDYCNKQRFAFGCHVPIPGINWIELLYLNRISAGFMKVKKLRQSKKKERYWMECNLLMFSKWATLQRKFPALTELILFNFLVNKTSHPHLTSQVKVSWLKDCLDVCTRQNTGESYIYIYILVVSTLTC